MKKKLNGRYPRAGISKILMKMKLMTIFLLVAFAATSANSYSQVTKFNLRLKDVTVKDVFQQIEENSEFILLYNEKSVDLNRKVSVLVKKDDTIESVLEQVFNGTGNNWKIYDRQIVILAKNETETSAGIKLQVGSVTQQPQRREITGTVKDTRGVSLPGVSVVVKGTSTGTVTGNDGSFQLQVPFETRSLVFSFIGMKSQELSVIGITIVNVVLEEETFGIEEVVAIGYGTMKKVNLTGSISTIDADVLTATPQPTLAQAIMGRAPGVFIKNVNAQPGESKISYNIRGFGTPLLIIDGFPASDNDFRQLDPNDIEEFSILKDAASAAVYGARAGNGVILITTKRGKDSDATFSFTGNYSLQFFAQVPNFVNSEMYARMENVSRFNEQLAPVWTDEQIQKFVDGSDPDRYPNTDWWKESLRKYAPQSQYNINVRGATDKVKYFVSGGYFTQRALTRTDDTQYDKYTLRSNLDLILTDKFSMGVDISLLYQEFMGPVHQVERTGTKEGIMGNIFRSRPYFVARYPDPTKLPTMGGADNAPNILGIENSGYNSWNVLTGDIKLPFTYNLPFGIVAKANYRIFRKYTNRKQFERKTPTYNYNWDTGVYTLMRYLNDPSRLFEYRQLENGIDQQYSFSWDNEFNDHSISALVISEILSYNDEWIDASRIRYDFDMHYLSFGPDRDRSNGGRASEDGRLGFVSRLNYNYKGKYLFEFNSRYDASPRFPKETRWGFFPSASLAWRISEENFIKRNYSFITNLKLRASHGRLGNDNIGNFQYLATYSMSTDHIFNELTNNLERSIIAGALPNPHITWEKMTTSNIGLDFNLWQSLLDGSIDYFYRLRTDVLGARIQSMPNVVGASMPNVNYAEYDNRGVEFSLSHKYKINNLHYSIGGNISWNREKTIFIDQSVFTNQEFFRTSNQIGQWTDRWWGRKTAGLFQTKEEIELWADQDGRSNSTILPGDVKFIDYNGDGRISSEDNVIIGRGIFPRVMFGIDGSLSWKGFDFNMLWQGAGLFDINIASALDYQLPFYAGNTPMTHMLEGSYVPEGNPWLPANTTNATLPRYRTDNTNRVHPSFSFSDFWLVNGAYIRLKSAELAYNLPVKVVNKIGIDHCKVYVSGYNLLTFSHYKPLDPEVDTHPRRIMGNYYPPVGSYNFGIMLNF
ncbi:MAG: hypothetical protein FD181_816 [Prolixibacteraceae bacterium]|nr:MAG: hypothetical protein FD181_816 [Prolixibacteraceae bacterium]